LDSADQFLSIVTPMKQLSILICTSDFEDPLSKQNWRLAQSLADTGHTVTLIVDHARGAMANQWKGCTILAWPSRVPAHGRDVRFFWRLLRQARPDVVLANFFSVNSVMILSSLGRVRCRVAWYRSLSEQTRLDFKRSRWKQAIVDRGKLLAYRLATHVVPISQTAQRDAAAIYGIPPEKCRVFHTCRPDPLLLLNHERQPKAEKPRIVCIGRLFPSKGQDVLIRAFNRLHELEPACNAELELIGEGPDRRSLEKLARELRVDNRVWFRGRIKQPDVLRRAATAHVMAVPCRTDAGPGVVPEGLGLGLPLVVAAAGALPELLGDSDAVHFVPPEDAEALAAGLRKVLTDSARREIMSRAARKLFLAKFLLDDWVRGVHEWIERIAAD
jgi:glycosyltransferase involved in cell wall biosynthesis